MTKRWGRGVRPNNNEMNGTERATPPNSSA